MEDVYDVFVAGTLNYLVKMLPGLLAAAILYCVLRPVRLKRLAKLGLASSNAREWAMLVFWLYCGAMSVLTLTPRWLNWYTALKNGGLDRPFFQPGNFEWIGGILDFFKDSLYLKLWALFFLAGNIVVFAPIGLFTGLLWRGCGAKRILLIGLTVTLCIESWQLCIGRTFDVSDIVLNTLGVMLGWLAWRSVDRRSPAFTAKFHVVPRKEQL